MNGSLPPQSIAPNSGSRAQNSAAENLPQRRPASEVWLQNPAWIDGAVRTPQFYVTEDEINATLAAYGRPPLHTLQIERLRSQRLPPAIPPQQRPSFTGVFAASMPQRGHMPPPPPPFAIPAFQPQAVNTVPQPEPVQSQPLPASVQSTNIGQDTQIDAAIPANRSVNPKPTTISQNKPVISVSMIYHIVTPSQKTTSLRGKQPVPEKRPVTKTEPILVASDMTRKEFIRICLGLHGLADVYQPSDEPAGPPFRLWWKGSAGGKGRATLIESNSNWLNTFQGMSLVKKPELMVEFDTKDMTRWKGAQHLAFLDADTELVEGPSSIATGTCVPQVSDFDASQKLHGDVILELKKKWTCTVHPGEHGEHGYCFIDTTTKQHYGLTPRKLTIWAAGIASRQHSLRDPPDTIMEGGERDSISVDGARPRGRVGPRSAVAPMQAINNGVDTNTLLATTLVPMAMILMERMSGTMQHEQRMAENPTVNQHSPNRTVIRPQFPVPPKGEELQFCLDAFLKYKDIDFTQYKDLLKAQDFTPDIIPAVPVSTLVSLLKAVEGQVFKFQAFCSMWNAQIEG